ncbi:MAG: hypothetical protein ACFFDP_08190 [Promethearchaeota archaeon]
MTQETSKSKQLATNIVYAFLLILLLVIAVWLLQVAAVIVKELAGAVLALGTGLILAFVKHQLTVEKERQSREEIARKEREHHELITKQENYRHLLSNIGNFVRNPEKKDDPLVSAHLGSLAFGDKEVILATNKFLKEPEKQENLINVLKAIRKASELPKLDSKFWGKYDRSVIFPKKTSGGYDEE